MGDIVLSRLADILGPVEVIAIGPPRSPLPVTGRCSRCDTTTTVYGPRGRPLCDRCRACGAPRPADDAYDGQTSRIYQVANFYLVATAILFTAYTSPINGKHYGLAAALAIAGLGLTALTTAVLLGQASGTAQAESGLTELQNRIASRLEIGPIRVAAFRPEEHGGALPAPSRSDS